MYCIPVLSCYGPSLHHNLTILHSQNVQRSTFQCRNVLFSWSLPGTCGVHTCTFFILIKTIRVFLLQVLTCLQHHTLSWRWCWWWKRNTTVALFSTIASTTTTTTTLLLGTNAAAFIILLHDLLLFQIKGSDFTCSPSSVNCDNGLTVCCCWPCHHRHHCPLSQLPPPST